MQLQPRRERPENGTPADEWQVYSLLLHLYDRDGTSPLSLSLFSDKHGYSVHEFYLRKRAIEGLCAKKARRGGFFDDTLRPFQQIDDMWTHC